MKAGFLRWASEVLHTSSRTITSLGIVVAFLFMAMSWMWDTIMLPAVRDSGAEILGIPDIVHSVQDVGDMVAAQSVQIERIDRRIDRLEPEPRVAEYDELRSQALAPCRRGETCQITIRSRRTDFGETCDAPTVTKRIFVDAKGGRFHPQRQVVTVPPKQDDEWSTPTVDFIVPFGAALGVGEYFIELEYTGCNAVNVDGVTVNFPPLTQKTLSVLVEVVE